jgi:imidazolonepropionase-like amidohydrolase
VAAQVIRRGDDLGTIEPGKLADIIVVDGNPLFDINALAHVTDVIKDGIIYKRNRVPTWVERPPTP